MYFKKITCMGVLPTVCVLNLTLELKSQMAMCCRVAAGTELGSFGGTARLILFSNLSSPTQTLKTFCNNLLGKTLNITTNTPFNSFPQ